MASMASLTGIALGVFLVTVLYRYIVYPALLSPLSRIPNAHWSVPILPTWIQRKRRLGAENRTIYSLHEKLGTVVRLGPNELSVNSADALRTVYTGAFEKDEWYRDTFLNFGVDNLVSTMGFADHSEQKRLLSRVYSKSYLQRSLDMQKISSLVLSKRLLPLLDDAARAGNPVNVFPLFEAVGMDFVSAYLFGTARGTNYLHDAHNWDRWLKSYDVFKFQSPQARRGGYLESWCLSLCESVEHPPATAEKGKDEEDTEPVVYGVLSQGLKKNQDQRPRQLAVASELLDHLVAGHETSGITFTYLMWQLSRHPKIQADLRRELLTLSPTLLFEGPAFRDSSSSSSSSSSLPSARSIDSLPLLDAMVLETLRLHAAAPGPLPRVSPSPSPEPTVVDGYTVPPGVRVSSSVYALHRNANVFPQPTKWLPRRWLDSTPDKLSDMRRLFMVFGRGGRMCLGSNFALQEIKLVVAALYTNYITEIESDDDGMEQEDAFIAPPIGRKLMLRFKLAGNEA